MKENLVRKTIENSFWNVFANVISKAGALIFVIIIARFLKPEGFGIYKLALSIALVFIIIADVGVNQTLVRYFSDALSKKNKKLAAAYFKYLLKIKTFLIIFFAFLSLILSYPLSFYVFKKPDLFFPLIIVSLYLIVFSFETFFEHIFYSIKKVGYIAIKEAVFQSLKIILVLAFFLLLPEGNHVLGTFFALILSVVLVFLMILFLLNRVSKFIFEKSEEEVDKKRVLSFLKFLTIGGISAVFFGYIDVIMIGVFLPSEYAGYYSAGFALISSAAFLISVSMIVLPVFTQLKKSQLKSTFDKVFKYSCMLGIPLVFGSIVLGRYLIKLIYGVDYLPASLPFSFLAPLIFSMSLANILVSLFSAKEKPKYFVNALLFSTFLNITLNYFLITTLLKVSLQWSMTGAAIATLTSRYFYLFSLGFLAKKKFNIKIKIKYILKPLISALIMALIIYAINTKITDMTLILGFLEILFGAIIYFVLMFILRGITKEDFKILIK